MGRSARRTEAEGNGDEKLDPLTEQEVVGEAGPDHERSKYRGSRPHQAPIPRQTGEALPASVDVMRRLINVNYYSRSYCLTSKSYQKEIIASP